ncbi:hypothetical protein CASFOL_025886 [Castilleja foliolosa]|uniref:Uncharacterized protein n=1 Tax=Castilleja foliolosa TaxID=1961234 RepID=A0ABD3CTU0_9LAMI
MKKGSIGKSASYEGGSQESNRRVKRSRSNGCFSFTEISIDPNVKSLKHLDSRNLKDGIKKWAKAVVTYARQVSHHFRSSRKSDWA